MSCGVRVTRFTLRWVVQDSLLIWRSLIRPCRAAIS